MPLSTTLAELIAKLHARTGPQPRMGATLDASVSAGVEYVDRVVMQFRVTEPQIDTEVTINTTIVTDIDPELVQSHTILAGVVTFTAVELLALAGAQGFLDALAAAAHLKLAAQRAALVDAPIGPTQPVTLPDPPQPPQIPPFP